MTETQFTQHPVPEHLSYSQASTLADCGERYRLERIYRVPQPPSWASVGGSALHLITEMLDWADLGDTQRAHAAADQLPDVVHWTQHGEAKSLTRAEIAGLAIELSAGQSAEILETTDGPEPTVTPREDLRVLATSVLEGFAARADPQGRVPRGDWKSYGRPTVKYPHGEVGDWWREKLPDMVLAWLCWRRTSEYRIAMLDDLNPAIEVDVSGALNRVRVQGFCDRVLIGPDDLPIVVDLKTSRSVPRSAAQLGLYAVLLEAQGFPKIQSGAFWMARTGKLSPIQSLHYWTRHVAEQEYTKLLDLRNGGSFVANTESNFCPATCSVATYCYAVGGEQSHLVPRPEQMLPIEIKEVGSSR